MSLEKENRFDGLMKTVQGKKENAHPANTQASKHLDVETSNHSDVQKSKKKSSKASKNLDSETSKHSDSQTSKTANQSSQNVSTRQHPNIQTSKAKSTNPDYMRTTIYLPKKMHKKLKAISVEEEKEMSSIVEELISAWLSSQG